MRRPPERLTPPRPRRRATLLAALALLGASCFEYSPHAPDLDASERDLNAKARARVQLAPAVEVLRFALVGDTQLAFDEATDLVEALRARPDLAFVVQLGDFTHLGIAGEFRLMNGIFARLEVPYFVVVGIHDLAGNGDAIYRRMFGPFNDTFDASRTRFVMFDSNSRDTAFDGTVPDLGWLAGRLAPDGTFDRVVLLSHIAPGTSDFDRALDAPYAELLRAQPWVVSFHGHEHDYRAREFAGTPLYVADSVDHRSYLVATIGPAGALLIERIPF